MKAIAHFAIVSVLSLVSISIVRAHEVRPGYLEIRQVDPVTYDLLWKIPARGDRRLGLYVRLPDNCRSSEKISSFVNGAYIERWRTTCGGGLDGGKISIDGLDATRTDVLVRLEHINGHTQTVRLTPSHPEFKLSGSSGPAAVVRTYGMLGVEHILLGFDHLLFVLALLFLVDGRRRLVTTITAFTAAHSLTLAAATFGWVRVPQAPVEAVIALSIMFVAAEILNRHRGRSGMATDKPWTVAFIFGLLHGLGFAAALRDVGLPNHAIPIALASFNLGVEAGQLLFVAAMFLLFHVIDQLSGSRGAAAGSPTFIRATLARRAAYVIGALSAFWFIERTYGFFV